MQSHKTKVLYIIAYERSGTTILSNVLGQIDGFFAAGEVSEIWYQGLTRNRPCGCGVPLKECEVWRRAADEAFGGIHQIDLDEMLRSRKRIRTRNFPSILLLGREQLQKSHLNEYMTNLEKFYRAIEVTTGSKVIVDTSKPPLYGHILGMLPTVDLYFIHLVRDPRSVEYSLLRRKTNYHSTRYLNHNSIKGSLAWNTMNLIIEMVQQNSPNHYLRLNFEDFVRQPQEAIKRILELVGEESEQLPFVDKHRVKLDITHTCMGNGNRFQTGEVDLKLDRKWKEEMKQVNKYTVTALTWPLLLRYGYLN